MLVKLPIIHLLLLCQQGGWLLSNSYHTVDIVWRIMELNGINNRFILMEKWKRWY